MWSNSRQLVIRYPNLPRDTQQIFLARSYSSALGKKQSNHTWIAKRQRGLDSKHAAILEATGAFFHHMILLGIEK